MFAAAVAAGSTGFTSAGGGCGGDTVAAGSADAVLCCFNVVIDALVLKGEVERVLSMVDAVLLVVDATEGPMSQTKVSKTNIHIYLCNCIRTLYHVCLCLCMYPCMRL